MYAEETRKENVMNKDWMEYTAADLEKMSEKELVDLLENMPKFERPSAEILATMDVGIYDDNGNRIGIKDGDDY